MTEAPSRRDRVRADTAREILDTARRILVAHGPDGLALRAIAREMGISAPALYRYYASREDLVEHLVADLYGRLCDVLEEARDAVAPDRAGRRLLVTARAFRGWATAHSTEFSLLFGSAVGGLLPPEELHGEGPAGTAGRRFGGIFATLMAQVYAERRFPVPADEDLDPALQEQLRAWCAQLPVQLPLGVMSVVLSCWIRLYGMVCLEVFGHLRFALADAGPMFEAEMRAIAAQLAIPDEYAPPGA